ncbi:Ribonuclease H [Anaeromyxobacter dehalogenans 2CP-1]|uniref:Ribonuclease HII n=2 Tax=Anaeromyxobacter dehalogenans TaxID=161493 RepID=B8J9V6_ANAD2|nr:ribonuclease HII [Anaeromyxobacter dehalogenans]ACL63659.1 Ribonuclease H [Anaeromyxobacter dehalogenans 2CP-1]
MRPEDLPRLSVAELRARLLDRGEALGDACEAALEADPRAGAREVLRLVRKRRRENRAEGQRLRHLLRYEAELWERGLVRVAGVDEAGMAPLAGPVVAGACVLPLDYRPRGIDDSKQLDRAERERLAEDIKRNAVCWAVARADVEEIDRLNIYWAGMLALRRAVDGLSARPEHLLVDARKLPDLPFPQTPIVHGDALSLTIAAASILAKTARDALMAELDLVHPGYGFARHKGYPTAEHFEALGRLGACPIHRRSFTPVRVALGLEPAQGDLFALADAAVADDE